MLFPFQSRMYFYHSVITERIGININSTDAMFTPSLSQAPVAATTSLLSTQKPYLQN
jgi:hypothetical protein